MSRFARFSQFEERGKHQWRSVTFSKVTSVGVFHVFKLQKWYQFAQIIAYRP